MMQAGTGRGRLTLTPEEAKTFKPRLVFPDAATNSLVQ